MNSNLSISKKCVENYIETRCEEQLSRNEKYLNIQKQMSEAYKIRDIELYSQLSFEMQLLIERESYKVALFDYYVIANEI